MSEISEISRRRFLEFAAAVTAGTRSTFGQALSGPELGLPADRVTVLRSKNPAGGKWPEVVAPALAKPLGTGTLRSQNLRGKRVVVMTDDWGRPTPASEVIPLVLDELHAAGAADNAITFVTASGMHVPMNQADLERKLGKSITERFHCVSHDAGDHKMLKFVAVSNLGTPIWVNRCVAEADFKVAIGRIAPHEAYGYEG
jgi:nickel-dependent lactate racemase